jgi:hypothetical protein
MNAHGLNLGQPDLIEGKTVPNQVSDGLVEGAVLKRRATVVLAGAVLLTLAWVGFLVWGAGKLFHEFVG